MALIRILQLSFRGCIDSSAMWNTLVRDYFRCSYVLRHCFGSVLFWQWSSLRDTRSHCALWTVVRYCTHAFAIFYRFLFFSLFHSIPTGTLQHRKTTVDFNLGREKLTSSRLWTVERLLQHRRSGWGILLENYQVIGKPEAASLAQ